MNKYRQNKKIHTTSFLKYFLLKVPSTELPDTFIKERTSFWEKKKNPQKEILKDLQLLQEGNKLLEFLKKLREIFLPIISKKVALSIIDIVYKNPDIFSKEGTENFWNSEYDKAEILLLQLIDEKIGKSEMQAILNKIVSKTPDFSFAVSVIRFCKETRGGLYHIYDSVNVNELKNILSSRLKEYFIDGKRNIFEELKEKRDWAYVLYQWSTNWEEFSGNNRKIVNNYLFSILAKDVKRFIQFLDVEKQPTFGGGFAFNLDDVGRAYELSELYKLVEKFKNNKRLTDGEKKLIQLFLEAYGKKFKKEDTETNKNDGERNAIV